jgi:hypothetical protein
MRRRQPLQCLPAGWRVRSGFCGFVMVIYGFSGCRPSWGLRWSAIKISSRPGWNVKGGLALLRSGSGCQPSTASRMKKPTTYPTATCHPPLIHAPTDRASGIQVGQRDAGRRTEPDHRAAEPDSVGQETPVVATLPDGQRGEGNVVETLPRQTPTPAWTATRPVAACRRASWRRTSPETAGRRCPSGGLGQQAPRGLAPEGGDQDGHPDRCSDHREAVQHGGGMVG